MRIIDFRLISLFAVAFLTICVHIDQTSAQEAQTNQDLEQPPGNPTEGDKTVAQPSPSGVDDISQEATSAHPPAAPPLPAAEATSQDATSVSDEIPPSSGVGTQESGEASQMTGAQSTATPASEADTQPLQEETTKKGKNALKTSSPAAGRNALGLSAGLSSGFGLSYRHYLTNVIALRVEGGIVASSSNAFYSLGLTVQEDFLRTYYFRFYGLQAFGLNKGGNDANLLLAPGAGAGFEYNFKGMRRGLSTRLELVLTPLIQVGGGVPVFTFLPQTGLFFVF